MHHTKANEEIVKDFIQYIWNEQRFEEISRLMHSDFIDHSLPPGLPANIEGTMLWIKGTGNSFEHRSVIEEQVTQDNKSMIKLKMFLKHIGPWRGIEPTGLEINTIGYRCFRIANGKIIEHWALLDGNAIESQLKNNSQGCKIQE